MFRRNHDDDGRSIPITGLTIEECRQLGGESAKVTVAHDDLTHDPIWCGILVQGGQAEQSSLRTSVGPVNVARTALGDARERRRLHEGQLLVQARALVRAGSDRDAFRQEMGNAGWFAETDLPTPALLFLFVAIALGEWVFNRAAFVITGEDALSVDVLAATVGVGLVSTAHLAGGAARRLLDDHVRTRGAKLAAGAGAAVVVAAALGVAGINVLRSTFFAEDAPEVPSGGMVLLQVFLLLVAVVASMVHANPTAKTQRTLDDAYDDALDAYEEAKDAWLALRASEREAEAALRSRLVEATAMAGIQSLQTARELFAFGDAVQAGVETPVVAPFVSVVRHREIGRWEAWLDGHPFDEDVPVVEELAALLAQVVGLEEALERHEGSSEVANDGDETDDADFVDVREKSPVDEASTLPLPELLPVGLNGTGTA